MQNLNRGKRYIVVPVLSGYIVYDRIDRVQIGNDCATIGEAIERQKVLLRRPERV